MSFITRVAPKDQLQGPVPALNIQVCIWDALIPIHEHLGLFSSNQGCKREGRMKRKQGACDILIDDDLLGSPSSTAHCIPPLSFSSFHLSTSEGVICNLSARFLSFFFPLPFPPSFFFSFPPSLHKYLFSDYNVQGSLLALRMQTWIQNVGSEETVHKAPRKLKGGVADSAWKLAKASTRSSCDTFVNMKNIWVKRIKRQ